MRLPRLSLGAPLVALALMLSPGSALGAANHPFLSAINPGAYEDACGVALHGGLYVSDYYRDTIVTPSGKISNVNPGDGPCKLAFDSGGNLYVNNWHRNVVEYTEPFNTPTVIDSDNPTGLTVDTATGNLYVAHRTYVAEYSSTGTLISDEIGLGSLQEGYGVAVSDFPATAGYLYVPDAATHTVKIYDPATELENPIEVWNGSVTPQGGFKYLVDSEVTVDNSATSPSYGHVFVLDAIGHGLSEHPEGAFDEFNAAGDYRGQIAGFTDAEPSGIAIDTAVGPSNGNLYISSGNSEGAAVFEYGPTAPARNLKVLKAGAGEGNVTSSPKGIECGTACSAEYNEAQSVTLFASPDAHSAFTGWSVSGSQPCPGTGSCTVLLASNVEVTATFSKPTQRTLTVSTTGSGTVSGAPGQISCPGVCSEEFNEGRVATLTAHPAPHNKLIGWSGCSVQANPAECKVTMGAAQALSAQFASIPQLALNVAKSGNGQGTVTSFPDGVSCGGTCSSQFDEGSTVYLLAAPAPTTSFGGFSGGGCSGAATICAVAMSGAQTISAQFGLGGPGASTGAVTARLSLGRVTVQGQTATLQLTVDGPGTVLAAGSGLQPLQRSVSGGQVRVALRLNRAARRTLQRPGHHRRRVKVAIAFVPSSGGTPLTAARTVTFRSDHGHSVKAANRHLIHLRG
jgi:Divergent InlB B-repeat domain